MRRGRAGTPARPRVPAPPPIDVAILPVVVFERLDFLYTPSSDVAADARFHVDVLGGRLVFAIDDGGTRVAMIELAAGSAGPCSPITWRAIARSSCTASWISRRRARAPGRLGARAIARDPAGSAQLIPDARRPPIRALPGDAAGRAQSFRGPARLLRADTEVWHVRRSRGPLVRPRERDSSSQAELLSRSLVADGVESQTASVADGVRRRRRRSQIVPLAWN